MIIKIFKNEKEIERWAKEYLEKKGYRIEDKKERIEKIKRAREKRTEEIKRKIKKAIEEMKKEKQEITAWSVSKKAKINYRTARKYLKEIKEQYNHNTQT